jgi:hypothetical protein
MQAQHRGTAVPMTGGFKRRASRQLLASALAATTALVLAAPAHAALVTQHTPGTRGPAQSAARSEGAAVAKAVATGERAEVADYRSETSQVFAEPDGGLTLETTAVPQRVRRSDGSWDDVNLNLHVEGGVLRPIASVADVRFSLGGQGPFVTLVKNGKSLSLSWDGVLPEPVVSGASAKYANVLEDVDLVVRATDLGFAHVLVVKSPAGAARVRQIRFGISGDARVVAHSGAGLQAVAGNVEIARAAPAVMWSSAKPAAVAHARTGSALAQLEASTAAEPGTGATIAPVAADVTDGDLVLRPDSTLLDASPAAFPLYVDPEWSAGKKRWAYATNNNTNNGDTSVARVGKDPESSRTYRSFFEFNTSFLKKKYVHDVTVQMELDHSASCEETWTHLYYSGAIASTPRTKWSPSLSTWVAAEKSRAPEGDGCDGKADQVVNFRDAILTKKVHDLAQKGKTSVMTFGFSARNADGRYEDDWKRWKKFLPNKAKLIVNYASYPGKPTNLFIGGVGCGGSAPVTIGTAEPKLSAKYPDFDGAGAKSQTLTASYEWIEWPANGTVTDTAPPRLPKIGSKSVQAEDSADSPSVIGVKEGQLYAIRTHATDPKPYSISGPWSAWCKFTVQTNVPAPPSLTIRAAPTLPGTPAVIELSSTNQDVRKFYYGWDDTPARSADAIGTTTRTAAVTLTAPRYGVLTFHAYAVDVTGNEGEFAQQSFTVGRPSEAIARWRLEGYPGSPQGDALNDAKPDVGGNTPLAWDPAAPDHGWIPDSRLVGSTGITFDQSKGGPGGWAKGPVPALDTAKSFSVTAWVKLADATSNQTAVSKDGSAMSAFRLTYLADRKSWCFMLRAKDQAGAQSAAACSAGATVGRWTQIAGVYDDAETKLKLYVDGVRVAEVDPSGEWKAAWAGGWSASGPIVVGRGLDAALQGPAEQFAGGIADVQLFDRVLVDHDFVGQLATDEGSSGFDEPGVVAPLRIGRWDFKGAQPCSGADGQQCSMPDVSGWNRPMTVTPGTDIGPGLADSALVVDDTPLDPPQGQPVHTSEYGYSQWNASTSGPPQLQDAPVVRTDQPFTVGAWVRLDKRDGVLPRQTVVSQDMAGSGYSGFDLAYDGAGRWAFSMRGGPAVGTAENAVSVAEDDPYVWHHLVAVFDPGRTEIRLYVDGDRAGTAALPGDFTPWRSTGPFVVGRSDQPGGPGEWLFGSLDNVTAWQGVLTDAAIHQVFAAESPVADPDSRSE